MQLQDPGIPADRPTVGRGNRQADRPICGPTTGQAVQLRGSGPRLQEPGSERSRLESGYRVHGLQTWNSGSQADRPTVRPAARQTDGPTRNLSGPGYQTATDTGRRADGRSDPETRDQSPESPTWCPPGARTDRRGGLAVRQIDNRASRQTGGPTARWTARLRESGPRIQESGPRRPTRSTPPRVHKYQPAALVCDSSGRL